MNKRQILGKIAAAILTLNSALCLADNCAVSNFSTGFLWEQILVPSAIGASVQRQINELEATIAEILAKTLHIDSTLDTIIPGSESILEESAIILTTSITISSLLDLLQTNANLIVSNLSILEVVTNVLNVDTKLNNSLIKQVQTNTNTSTNITNYNLSIVENIDSILINLNSLLEPILTCTVTSISSTYTISTPGDYCVAVPFTGSITIASSNVALNLNGNTITNPSATVITINPNLQKISITNGSLNSAVTGLKIGSGVTDLELTYLQILNCTSAGISGAGTTASPINKLRFNNSSIRNASSGIGLQLANTVNSQFELCDFALCATGVQLTSCFDIAMNTCDASRNTITGFSLVTSGTNYFRNCTANINGAGSTGSSYGFISTNGVANIFDSCIADGTTTLTTNVNSVVAGFALTGSEMCTKIVGCEGCNATAPYTIVNTTTILAPTPYGIFLQSSQINNGQPTPNSIVTTGNVSSQVRWSPNQQYIAIVNTADGTLQIFNASNPITPVAYSAVATNGGGSAVQPNDLSWSPNGQYIAVVNYGVGTLQTFNVTNPTSPVANTPVSTGSGSGSKPFAVRWSPNGQYIALVNAGASDNTLQIFNASNPAVPVAYNPISTGVGSGPQGLDWSPNGQYIAVINYDIGTMLIFNASNPALPVQIASISTGTGSGSSPQAVNWSPNGQYIAVVNAIDGTLQTFNATNPASPIANTPISTGNSSGSGPVSVSWSPNGQYIAVVNFLRPFNSLQTFNATNPTAPAPNTSVTTSFLGNSVNWSPDGQYIVMVNNASPGHLQTFNALQFPTNNVIENNVTYCNLIATGTTQYFGAGISGSNIANLIVSNTSYNNLMNYQFVTQPGIYNELFNYLPSPLQNISQPGGQAVNYPVNIVPYTNAIQTQVQLLQTQIDTIYANMCIADSQADQLLTNTSLFTTLITNNSILDYQLQQLETQFNTAESQMGSAISVIDLFLTSTISCFSTPITAPITLSTSGIYCLSANGSGPIVITADAVSLDLNGYVLTNTGITINPGVKLATIKNGTISNANSSGIVVSAGTSATKITNVNVELATNNGILLQNTESCVIKNCDLSLNATGLEIESSNKVIISNCYAIGNGFAGFNLVSSGTNVFLDCKAVGNGGSSTSNGYGFASSNGMGNIFERCIATGNTSASTNPSNIVAGFALLGSEMCSKIIDSKSCDNFYPNLTVLPYGILLQDQFTSISTFTTVSDTPIPVAVSWSPDNKFLATVDNNNNTYSSGTLRIFSFNPSTMMLSQATTFTTTGNGFTDVAWSPNGNFIATSETNSGFTASNIRIFTVNEFSPTVISQVGTLTISGTGFGITAIAWSPNNNYLVAGDSGSNIRTFALNYLQSTGNALTQIGLTSLGTGTVFSLAWNPSGNYVTVVTNTIFLYQLAFNPSASSASVLSKIQSLSVSISQNVANLSWSYDGNFLAVATNTLTPLIYQINQTTGLLTPFGSQAVAANAVSWAPNDKYLAVISSSNALTIYSFASTNMFPLTSLGTQSVAGSQTLAWGPDGEFVATNGTNTAQIFKVLSFPTENIIKNNTLACNSATGATSLGQVTSGGYGISGSSINNLIINNLTYNNPINTAFVTNVFTEQLFGNSVPSPLQNNSLISQQPLVKPENANLLVDNIQTIATAMQNKVNYLYRSAFP